MGKRMNIFEGMRMGQRLVWTRTELAKFQELEDLYNHRLFIKDPLEFEKIKQITDPKEIEKRITKMIPDGKQKISPFDRKHRNLESLARRDFRTVFKEAPGGIS